MARFAGDSIDLTPHTFGAAGGGSNYSAAAGVVDVNNALATQRAKSPKYGDLSAYAMKTEADKFNTAVSAAGDVTSAGLTAYGNTLGQVKAAEAQAEATKSSGMMSAIGGIAGAGLKLLTGGIG